MGRKYKQELIDELANGYEQILEHALSDASLAENKSERTIARLIHNAKSKIVALKTLSQEQVDEVADYVARDVSHLRDYVATTGEELGAWLGFEAVVLESEILDLLLRAADPTTVESILRNSEGEAELVEYAAGEIAGPGSLICRNCDAIMKLHRAATIPVCPTCGDRKFARHTN